MIFADRYKMANFQCEGLQVEVDTDHSLGADGFVYVSGVTVKIGTNNKDGTVTYQTNKLALSKLTRVRTLSLFFFHL